MTSHHLATEIFISPLVLTICLAMLICQGCNDQGKDGVKTGQPAGGSNPATTTTAVELPDTKTDCSEENVSSMENLPIKTTQGTELEVISVSTAATNPEQYQGLCAIEGGIASIDTGGFDLTCVSQIA